jgi:uncharacterized protein YebE (UPF0316 family)
MYIYLLEDVTDNNILIYKIGFATNIVKRMKAHRTSNPSFILVNSFETKYNRKVETALHNIHKSKLYGGEWYCLDDDDVNKFTEKCEMIEKNFDSLKDNPFFI